jgi:hypothetical protein
VRPLLQRPSVRGARRPLLQAALSAVVLATSGLAPRAVRA